VSKRSWDTSDAALVFLRRAWADGDGAAETRLPDAESRFAAWLRASGLLTFGEPRPDKPWVAGAGRSLQTTSLDAIGLDRLEAAGQVVGIVTPKDGRRKRGVRRAGGRRSRMLPPGFRIAA
jgi:hypothetical protein